MSNLNSSYIGEPLASQQENLTQVSLSLDVLETLVHVVHDLEGVWVVQN